MAETLGSLVDKLTIKDIRGYHLREMMAEKDTKFTNSELTEKLKLLERQKLAIMREMDAFVGAAANGDVPLRDEKIKLYNAREVIGKVKAAGIGDAVSGLASKNLELWHLEDEARRKDVELSYIGEIKRKIDLANQQRNDFIDKIDELFEGMVKRSRKQ